jgi:hypothetical protein
MLGILGYFPSALNLLEAIIFIVGIIIIIDVVQQIVSHLLIY